jgi:hypothetical protein
VFGRLLKDKINGTEVVQVKDIIIKRGHKDKIKSTNFRLSDMKRALTEKNKNTLP